MNHIADANKMVDTPRTDEAYFKNSATMYDLAGEMKRVERELNAANDRIKRLDEAGDAMSFNNNPYAVRAWNKAKEAKL